MMIVWVAFRAVAKFEMYWEGKIEKRGWGFFSLRPGSDAVPLMSLIEFNELSSCEVQRLNQLRTADLIRIGSAIFPTWLSLDGL